MTPNRLLSTFTLAAIASAALAEAAGGDFAHATAAVDDYVKLIGAVIAGLGFVFGVPVTWFTIRKTRAEILKLELESAALRAQANAAQSLEVAPGPSSIDVRVADSPNSTINVTADPRLAAPLLVLMDFVTAFVLITIGGYAVDVALSYFFNGLPAVLIYVAFIGLALSLLFPIVRQANRVRKLFGPAPDSIEQPQA